MLGFYGVLLGFAGSHRFVVADTQSEHVGVVDDVVMGQSAALGTARRSLDTVVMRLVASR